MRHFNEEAQSDRLGFELGFDMFRFGIKLESIPRHDAITKGFEAAEAQRASRQKQQTIYDKKLIQIRCRAYHKGITVDLTVDDLKNELKRTGGNCPITGEALTFNKGSDTDWSVDRVDNDIGYTPSNIFIMSSRANVYKSDISMTHLMRYALGDHDSVLLEEPRFAERDKDFWSRLFLCLYRKMPARHFFETVRTIFYQEADRTSSVISGMVQIIMSNELHTAGIKSFEKAIMKSPTLRYYIMTDALLKTDIRKLRKASIAVRRARPFDLGVNISGNSTWESTQLSFLAKAEQMGIDGVFLTMREDIKEIDNLVAVLVEILDFCLTKWRDVASDVREVNAA